MSGKQSIAHVSLDGKRVLIRVDFNVPFNKEDGTISNLQRIQAALPTIEHALTNGAKSVVLMSHLGRPEGRKQDKFSLRPVAVALQVGDIIFECFVK
jgi:phosphoglycerate kinase